MRNKHNKKFNENSDQILQMSLYDGTELFVNCNCDDCIKSDYTISHTEKPMLLSDKLMDAIEMLLWYSPNNSNSVQSFTR